MRADRQALFKDARRGKRCSADHGLPQITKRRCANGSDLSDADALAFDKGDRQAGSTAQPASTSPLNPPALRTSTNPMSFSVLPASAARPPEPQVQDHRTIIAKRRIVGRQVGVGAEFEQSAGDRQSPLDLSAGRYLGSVPNIDQQSVGLFHELRSLGRRHGRDSSTSGGEHVFYCGGHDGWCLLSQIEQIRAYSQRHHAQMVKPSWGAAGEVRRLPGKRPRSPAREPTAFSSPGDRKIHLHGGIRN